MAVSAEKQRVAEEVASILKLSVDIDTTPYERSTTLSELFLTIVNFAKYEIMFSYAVRLHIQSKSV